MRPLIAALLASVLTAACSHAPAPQAASGESQIFAVQGASEPEQGKVGKGLPDLLIPGWKVEVTQLDEDRYRLALRMRTLITGGDGEARTAFLRGARELVDAGGFAGFDVVRYEEGIDSGFLFGRRSASGVIRVVRSQTWGM